MALRRGEWPQADPLRPLNERGNRQAAALVGLLAEFPLRRILSSPFVRCLQTVAPLAAARGLEVESHQALAEGGGGAAAQLVRTLVGEGSDAGVVLCSHGDVIPEVLQSLDAIAVEPDRRRCQKGSTWFIESVHGELVATRYLPPPP